MASREKCARCGNTFDAIAFAGACPHCLMRAGLNSRAGQRGVMTPPSPAEIAEYFPRLEILEVLGFGGMGIVYKVRQIELDRIAALKILSPEYLEDPTFAERFQREARALAKLTHPHIVGIYDLGMSGGFCYFLMEYVEGINLRQAIRSRAVNPSEALEIIPQICDALQFAHSKGIVHRDIKPENILLTLDGQVKVADFGLAKLLDSQPTETALTGTLQALGTPRYMAPEQVEGNIPIDHRADIYSLGVVIYELLTGELPMGRFPEPSKKSKVDRRIDPVVMRTLEKEPSARYQKISEVSAAINSLRFSHKGNVSTNWATSANIYPGYDYKSKAMFLGFPVVHCCSGFDPVTGKPRIARGLIAVGDNAVGGLAIGGSAVGVVAIGGASVGLIAIGGAAIGLLQALGGGAIGGLAIGGGAIGFVAIGGGSFGGLYLNGSGFHLFPGLAEAKGLMEFWSRLGPLVVAVYFVGMLIGALSLIFGLAGVSTWKHRRSLRRTQTTEGVALHSTGEVLIELFGMVLGALVLVFIIGALALPRWLPQNPATTKPSVPGAKTSTSTPNEMFNKYWEKLIPEAKESPNPSRITSGEKEVVPPGSSSENDKESSRVGSDAGATSEGYPALPGRP